MSETPTRDNTQAASKLDVNSLEVQLQLRELKTRLETTEGYLKAPNGNATNLTEQQWLLTRTQAFSEWFGDWQAGSTKSLLDNNGEPKVLYHGTPFGGFDEFNADRNAYFTESLDYARKYKNPSASSTRGYRGDDSFGEVKGVFVRANDVFDTRNDEVRKVYEEQFYMQWGDGTPLSDRGLLDWTEVEDALEFIEENELDYDVVVADEGGVPSANNDGVEWHGESYAVRSGSQALILDGDFLPEVLKEDAYTSEIERQMADVLSVTKERSDYLKNPDGKDTKLNQSQWLLARTPAFKAWYGDWETPPAHRRYAAIKEPAVLYASSNDNNEAFTQELASKPYIAIYSDKEAALNNGLNAHPVIANVQKTFVVSEETVELLRRNEVEGLPEREPVGFDSSYLVTAARMADPVVGRYLDYVSRYGTDKGTSMWDERHNEPVDSKYLDPDSDFNLTKLAAAFEAGYSNESFEVFRKIGIDDESLKLALDMDYIEPLTWDSLSQNGERAEEIFEAISQLDAGFDSVSTPSGIVVLDTSPDVIRSIGDIPQSFKDYGQRAVETRNYNQARVNATAVMQAEIENLQARLQLRDDYMQAPNGKPTKLSEQQWLQVRTDEFKNWYGDWESPSAKESDDIFLDDNGEPAVFYHGTPDARFVDETGVFANTSGNPKRNQHWFTQDKVVAQTYANDKMAFDARVAEPAVLETYVKMNNPLIVEGRARQWREAQYDADSNHILDVAREQGRDGVVIKNVYDNYNTHKSSLGKLTTTYVVFNESNIKSANLNNGEFNPNTPDIRYSVMDNTVQDEQYLTLARQYIEGDLTVAGELDHLIKEQAARNGFSEDVAHRMSHEAPYKDDEGYHSSLDDVTDMFGSDIYTPNAVRYFSTGMDDRLDTEAVSIIQKMRGNPDGLVTIYRAVPKGVTTEIYNHDWVSITKGYAEMHGEAHLDNNYDILEKTVPAKDLYTDANSIQEWGYDNGVPILRSENGLQQKQASLVTFDDDGEIIPLSKRFSAGNDDPRYSFIGENAFSVNQVVFNEAERRILQGEDVEKVRQDTGWFAGADGKMRLEIDDSDASVLVPQDAPPFLREFRLSNVFEHEQLYKAYPQLVDYHVRFVREEGRPFGDGNFNAQERTITLYVDDLKQIKAEESREVFAQTIIHETQHAIQHIEGFAVGTSVQARGVLTNNEYYAKTGIIEQLEAQKAALIESDPVYQKITNTAQAFEGELREKYDLPADRPINWNKLSEDDADKLAGFINEAYEQAPDTADAVENIDTQIHHYQSTDALVDRATQYANSAGERMAVVVQKSLRMTPEERRRISPEERAGLPFSQQMVEFAGERRPAISAFVGNPQDYSVDKIQDLREQIKGRIGAKTLGRLEAQGKLNIIPDYPIEGVEGFYTKGAVTLVAKNLTKKSVIPTLLHEMGGHAGFQEMLAPKQYKRLMGQFESLVSQDNEDALKAKRLAERDPANQHFEYLPYYLTVTADKKSTSLVKNTVSAVKAWAFERLGAPLKMNPNDLVALSERMIKKFAAPEVNLNKAREQVLFSKQDTKLSPSPYDRVPSPRFIDPVDDIYTVSEPDKKNFKAGVDFLFKEGNRYDYFHAKTPPALLALGGHPYRTKNKFGTAMENRICNIQDAPFELSRHTKDKIVGLREDKQDDSHKTTKYNLETLLEQVADPVAIMHSKSSDGLIVVIEGESKGRPLFVSVDPNRPINTHNTPRVVNYISTVFGKNDPQKYLINQIEDGRMLYFNPEKEASDINSKVISAAIRKTNPKPFNKDTLRVRHYERVMLNQAPDQKIENLVARENLVHTVFTATLEQGKEPFDDAVIESAFKNGIIHQGTVLSIDIEANTVTIDGKEIKAPPPPAPVKAIDMLDAQYLSERESSLTNRMTYQKALREAIRENPKSQKVEQINALLKRDHKGQNPSRLFRYDDLSDREKIEKLGQAIASVQQEYDAAESDKIKRDFDAIFDLRRIAISTHAASLTKNEGISPLESLNMARLQVDDGNTINHFIRHTFKPYDEYKNFLSDVAPLPTGYRAFVPMTPDIEGIAEPLNRYAKQFAIEERNLQNIKNQRTYPHDADKKLSASKLAVRTYKMNKAGLMSAHGGIITNGVHYEPKDGEFLLMNRQNTKALSNAENVVSNLQEFHIAAGLHDSVAIAKNLEVQGRLDNAVVIDAFNNDNMVMVLENVAQLNEQASVTVYSNDATVTSTIDKLQLNNPHVAAIQSPKEASWGYLFTKGVEEVGAKRASELFTNIVQSSVDDVNRRKAFDRAAEMERHKGNMPNSPSHDSVPSQDDEAKNSHSLASHSRNFRR